MGDDREHLMQRIRLLPADLLPYVEQLLTRLECGDLSPLLLRPSNRGGARGTTDDHRRNAAAPKAAMNCRTPKDIGCRYTPEMIEMCKKALELRAKGIIRF